MRTSITQNERIYYTRLLNAARFRSTNIMPDTMGQWPNEYTCHLLSMILGLAITRNGIFLYGDDHDHGDTMTGIQHVLMGDSHIAQSDIIPYVFGAGAIDVLTLTGIYDVISTRNLDITRPITSILNLKHMGVSDATIDELSERMTHCAPLMASMRTGGLDAMDIMYTLRGYHDDGLVRYVDTLFDCAWTVKWTTRHTMVLRHIDEGMLDTVQPSPPQDIIQECQSMANRHATLETMMTWLYDSMPSADIHEECYMVKGLHAIKSIMGYLSGHGISDDTISSGIMHYPDWICDILDIPEEFIRNKIVIMAQ